MTPEFRRAIGFTLWGMVAVLFIVELFLRHHLRAYVKERYPEKAKLRGWRSFGMLKQEMKVDPVLKQLYRRQLALTWAEAIVAGSAASLSDWHLWIF